MPFWKVWTGKEKTEEATASVLEEHTTADGELTACLENQCSVWEELTLAEVAIQASVPEHCAKPRVDPRDSVRQLYLSYVLRGELDEASACLSELASKDIKCARSVVADLLKISTLINMDHLAVQRHSETPHDTSHPEAGIALNPRHQVKSVRQVLVSVSRDSSSDYGSLQSNTPPFKARPEPNLLSPYTSTESDSQMSRYTPNHKGSFNHRPPYGFDAYQCDLCDARIRRTAAFESHMRNAHALVFGQKSRTTFAITSIDARNAAWAAKLRCRNGMDTFIEGELVPRTPAGPAIREVSSQDYLERRGTCAISSTSDEIGIPPGKRNRTIIGTNLCSPITDAISSANKKRDQTQISPTESTFGNGKRYKPNSPTMASPQSARLPITPPWMSDGLRAQLSRSRGQEARSKAYESIDSDAGETECGVEHAAIRDGARRYREGSEEGEIVEIVGGEDREECIGADGSLENSHGAWL